MDLFIAVAEDFNWVAEHLKKSMDLFIAVAEDLKRFMDLIIEVADVLNGVANLFIEVRELLKKSSYIVDYNGERSADVADGRRFHVDQAGNALPQLDQNRVLCLGVKFPRAFPCNVGAFY